MKKYIVFTFVSLLVLLSGCENTDIWLATEAGLDAVTAITLSDEAVQELAKQSSSYADSEQVIAPAGNTYAKRLTRLIGDHLKKDGITFNYKVYLSDEVNAFAMADGTIRVYSGLMDMLDDGELRFVIGHEMGHVAREHIRQKIQMAYAASAIRKGLASQNNTIGDIARSQLGGFVELLTGAQFSQYEEKIADDYGLSFLIKEKDNPEKAVSALLKLATLGSNHTFLSSHPEPGKRAERLNLQLQGKAQPIEEVQKNLLHTLLEFGKKLIAIIMGLFQTLLNQFG